MRVQEGPKVRTHHLNPVGTSRGMCRTEAKRGLGGEGASRTRGRRRRCIRLERACVGLTRRYESTRLRIETCHGEAVLVNCGFPLVRER